MKDRFKLVVIILIIVLVGIIVWALFGLGKIVSVHAQTSPQVAVVAKNPIDPEKPVCSKEELGKTFGMHAPELTSCDSFIAWQDQVAENLGMPKVTRNVYNRRGRLIKKGNFEELKKGGKLVPVFSTQYLDVSLVPYATRYTYPQVKAELEKVALELFTLRHVRLPLVSLLRFYETRKEGNSIHRRGLAADISCRYLSQEDVDVLRQILIRHAQQNACVLPTEESYVGLWVNQGINEVITYHVVVFNASFLETYFKPAN